MEALQFVPDDSHNDAPIDDELLRIAEREEAERLARPAHAQAIKALGHTLGPDAVQSNTEYTQGEAEKLFEELIFPAFTAARADMPNVDSTQIQKRIAEVGLYIRGFGTTAIAEQIGIQSVSNVANHIHSFYKSLNVKGYTPEYFSAVLTTANEIGGWPEPLPKPVLQIKQSSNNGKPKRILAAKARKPSSPTAAGQEHSEERNDYEEVVNDDVVPSERETTSEDADSEFDEVLLESARRTASQEFTSDTVRAYLKQIGKVALLTKADEIELSKRIEAGMLADKILLARQDGPDAVRKLLIDHYLGLKDYHSDESYEKGLKREALNIDADLLAITALADATRRLSTRDLRSLARDSERAKNHLVEANLRLVVSLAKRYTGHGMAFLDIIQEGNKGLIRAVEKFDYKLGWKFSTYSTWWIRQSITRAMADQARTIRLPVHMVEQVNKLERTEKEMADTLGRDPTTQELVTELDITEERIVELRSYKRTSEPISLDQEIGDDGDAALGDFLEDTLGVDADAAANHGFLQDEMATVLATLTEREAGVIRLRFGLVDGIPKTLDEIGQVYGLTRERIRQIEAKTMSKLRHPSRTKSLRDYLD